MHNFNDVRPTGERRATRTDVSCAKCSSACCRKGVILPLTEDEYRFLTDAGTELAEHFPSVIEPRLLRKPIIKPPLYKMLSNCAFNNPDTGECEAYVSDERPDICTKFRMGSSACVAIQRSRVMSGEDDVAPVELGMPGYPETHPGHNV